MRRSLWFFLAVLTSMAAMSFAGDVQVICEPGLRILLDGKVVGVSTVMQDGLFLAKIDAGQHTLRVEKGGFLPQIFELEVPEGPIEVKLGEFSPEPAIKRLQEERAATAVAPPVNLVVTSAPQICTVEIDGKREEKHIPNMVVEGLKPGEHTITFSKEGYRPVTGVVKLQSGPEVTVRGDLINGKIEVVYEGKGSLRLFSTPKVCSVHLLGHTRDKVNNVLNWSFIPAGEHDLIVTWRGLQRRTNVLITDGRRTIVTVNFMSGGQPFVITSEPE